MRKNPILNNPLLTTQTIFVLKCTFLMNFNETKLKHLVFDGNLDNYPLANLLIPSTYHSFQLHERKKQ